MNIRPHDRIVVTTEPWDWSKVPTEGWPQKVYFKPFGLWYGIGTSWIDWCESEMPESATGYVHRVDLDLRHLLRLRTVEDILAFDRGFGRKPYGELFTKHDAIDWPEVARQWTGIEIDPYQWGLRMEGPTAWYYSWDTASGCVWTPSAILGAEALECIEAERVALYSE